MKAQDKYDEALFFLEIYSAYKDTLRQNQNIIESNRFSNQEDAMKRFIVYFCLIYM